MIRIPDYRLSKVIFHEEMQNGKRFKVQKNISKDTSLKSVDIDPGTREAIVQDRIIWVTQPFPKVQGHTRDQEH